MLWMNKHILDEIYVLAWTKRHILNNTLLGSRTMHNILRYTITMQHVQFTVKHSSCTSATTSNLIVWFTSLVITLSPSPTQSQISHISIWHTLVDAVQRHVKDNTCMTVCHLFTQQNVIFRVLVNLLTLYKRNLCKLNSSLLYQCVQMNLVPINNS